MRLFCMLFLLVFSLSAHAASSLHANQISVAPQDAPKVIEALKVWMDGYGSKSNGRVVVLSHIADGPNPATHTILSMSPSMTDREAFSNKVTGSEEAMAEWQTLLNAVVPISQITSTSRSSLARSWGKIDDDNKVWLVHAMTTNDAASVVRALDAWMNSPTGKKFPGEAHLMSSVAGSPASHFLALGYDSHAEMEEWGTMAGQSGDLSRLLHSLSGLTQYHGASLSSTAASFGKSAKSVLKAS